ncbi:NnrS family protein [Dermatophilus congolensis]|uniref:NnrS family protein n=1 Tax=Dermatophilus congolensis TaxID=1863 RepID=UPI001AB01558|nr:hypothetical protein [Dermatophilus congolensis]MBO3131130.1 hypothetical protein [Dermatophilus congolensis]MBO3134712.1 hypothetical protein [Dermatophilus congolensis]MBO3136947.1 hypothetical protein [Dermatophilus congolensis]MBO3139193.1 hypothetical protein [Dermatophilus congolensis]
MNVTGPAPLTPKPTTWPATGPWAASSRIPYLLLCLWAAVAIPLWIQNASWLPYGWHDHEMIFAMGSGALASYVPTAQSSWTGLAPSRGWPVAVLAVLWVTARAVMFAPPGTLPRPLYAAFLAAPLWWTLALVVRDLHRSRRGPRRIGPYPCAVLAFCAAAGAVSGWFGSAIMTGEKPGILPEIAVSMFALLLTGVGGRMVPAFLNSAGQRLGLPTIPLPAWARLPILIPLGIAVLTTGTALSAALTCLAGMILAAHMTTWRLRYARYDSLAALTLIAYAWLPIGLILWGWTRLPANWPLPPAPVWSITASHTLTMGALTGLIVTVMARSSARRGDRRLHPRAASVIGFAILMAAVPVRLAGFTPTSGMIWSLGWGVVLLGHLPHLVGPLQRPVFSARRTP